MTHPAAESTRQRLLAAATAIVEEEGYGGASTAAIAKRAGVSTGALYRHFASKAELFAEVLRASTQEQLLDMRAAGAREEAFGARLTAVVETYAANALANQRLAWALVYEPVDPVVDAERLAGRRLYRDELAGLLAQGIAAGELDSGEDPALLAAVIVGGIAEALAGPLSPLESDVDAERVTAAIVSLTLRTVGARQTS